MTPAHRIRTFAATAALVAVGALAYASTVARGAQPAPSATLPPPNKSFSLGNLHFDRYGQGEPALILIPGLSMGAWTWQSQIAAFSADHAVYAATLAGFDGTPASSPPYLAQADAAIVQLVRQENLTKPVLVGHSFGGHLALRLVEERSDLFGGAIIIDETPYFPPLQPGQTVAQRAQNISATAEAIQNAPDWLYAEQTHRTVEGMVNDGAQVDNVVQHSLRSDRATLAGATSEMWSEDLRPGLSKITAPVLVIAPVSHDAPYMTDALRALTPDQLAATVRNFYLSEYVGTKMLTVQTIANSKDFVMLDQPDALNAAIKTFISPVARP